jgi:hypothetical protein
MDSSALIDLIALYRAMIWMQVSHAPKWAMAGISAEKAAN